METTAKKSLLELIQEKSTAPRAVEVVKIRPAVLAEKVVVEKFVPDSKTAETILNNVASDYAFAIGDKISHFESKMGANEKMMPELYSAYVPGINAFLSIAGNQINIRVSGTTRTVGKVESAKSFVIFDDQKQALTEIGTHQKKLLKA